MSTMTGQDWIEELDERLHALPVHDAGRDRAERTRARCVARLRPARAPRWRATLDWVEPLAAVGLGALYLAAALQAATLLLRLES
jgi:hypothetical protein